MGDFKIVRADLTNPDHRNAVLFLINSYAMDQYGNGKPLSRDACENLIPGLSRHPTALVFLALADNGNNDSRDSNIPAGILTSFRGFSTFNARPVINIHDFFVLPAFRGKNLGRRLLAAVEKAAREINCIKLTLEVQENNRKARGVYAAAGFDRSVYEEEAGPVVFLAKPL